MKRSAFLKLAGGAALVRPLPAHAQKTARAVIGLLTTATPDASVLGAIHKGLGERGYVEGRNVAIVAHSAEGRFDRLPALAAELVERKVSVILGIGGPVPARSAKAVTTTIPIVFAYGGDPVIDGLVAGIGRPGGNVTGATFIGTALSGKRLQLLRELLPRMADVALLINPKSTLADGQIKDAEAARRTLGLRLSILNVGSAGEIDDAFETMSKAKTDALMIGTDPTLGLVYSKQIIAQAARRRIPAIYPTRLETNDGGLMSYGASFPEAVRKAASYVGRILDGERPIDLPVLEPTTFETVINVRAAKALGLVVPPSLLAIADDVIE